MKHSIFDSSYTQRVQAIQSEKANKDTVELGTEMNIKNPITKWY